MSRRWSPVDCGPAPPPDYQGVWHCVEPTRADGCPGLPTTEGTCCSVPAHDCGYAGSYALGCKAGQWVVVHPPVPPA